jgi:hypothetical protein
MNWQSILRTASTIGLLSTLLSACGGGSVDIDVSDNDNIITVPPLSNSTVGIWRSQGSGLVASLTLNNAQLFEVTSVSCIMVFDQSISDLEANVVESLSVNGNDELVAPLLGASETLLFDRQQTLPETCEEGETGFSDDPEKSFEVFWHTFNENYTYFSERGIDWQQIYSDFRSRVTPDTSKAQLFDIMVAILSKFGDAHISLNTGSQFFDGSATPEFSQRFIRANDPQVNKIIQNNYLGGNFQVHSSGGAYWGDISDDVGYVNLNRFSGFGGSSSDRREHDRAFDRFVADVLQVFMNKKSIIIDVRNNGGGGDARALRFASMFSETATLLYTEKTRHLEGFTPEVPFVSLPSGEEAFEGNVAVLTSLTSVSSAEQFAMNMMPFEQVTIVGENTNGAFSQLERVLPNGWRFSLSNQIVVAANGEDYEVRGIPPEVFVESFTAFDFEQQTDSAIETALQIF